MYKQPFVSYQTQTKSSFLNRRASPKAFPSSPERGAPSVPTHVGGRAAVPTKGRLPRPGPPAQRCPWLPRSFPRARAEICPLLGPGAGSQSRCPLGWFLPAAVQAAVPALEAAGDPGGAWLIDTAISIRPVCTWPSSLSKCPLLTRTPVMPDQGPTPLQCDLILADSICKDPVSTQGRINRWGGGALELQPENSGSCSSARNIPSLLVHRDPVGRNRQHG